MIRSCVAALLMLAAAAAYAQESFVIERIDVESQRTIPKIIQAETRLVTGRAYTREQLDQALYRIRRLPFVADATYTLEPGSNAGARVLRITLNDEKRFNYDFDVQGVATQHGYVTFATGFGLRFFPGETGVLDLTLGGAGASSAIGSGNSQFGDLNVTYTQYAIGGKAIVASAGASRDYSSGRINPTAFFGLPLTQTQTARVSYQRTGDEHENTSLLSAQWAYETIDDPYFARHGLDVSVGPRFQRLGFNRVFNEGTPREFRSQSTINSRGGTVAAAKYWALGETSTWFGRGNALFTRETGTNNGNPRVPARIQMADALFGLGHNFDGARGNDSHSENGFYRLRLELAAGYHRDRVTQGQFTADRSGPQLFGGITYRSTVGLIRVGVGYVTSD